MITTIVILAYVASVFMARWFNKEICRIDVYSPKPWGLWFIPFFGVVVLFSIYIGNLICRSIKGYKIAEWFIGDNW